MEMDPYFDRLRAGGADLVVEIEPERVVTAPWTIYKCKFGCPVYGTSWCCPPNTPTYRETRAILDSFRRAVLFRTHAPSTVTPLAAALVRELFLDGYYKAIGFGDGDCQLCGKCAADHCRFPGRTVPSMEACGIDVFATVRDHGLEIRTLRERGEEHNHFGLVLMD